MSLKCPRCGQAMIRIYVKQRRGREYLYAYHGKQVFCYLGSAGKYVHVERVLGLGLSGLGLMDYLDVMRLAFDKALDAASKAGKIEKLREALLAMLREIEVWTNLPKAEEV